IAPRQRGHSPGHAMTRLRATLRLAWRQVRRAKGASALVVLLVALPMTLVSAAVVYADSRIPTLAENISAEVGDADAWIQVVGGYDPSRSQSIEDPWWWYID